MVDLLILAFMKHKQLVFLSILFAAIFLLPLISAFPQEQEEVIELLHADNSEMSVQKDSLVISLYGDVQFRHGTSNLRSDRAIWYKTSGLIVFMGKVRVEDQDQYLLADRVIYYERYKKAVADGNVKLVSQKEDAIISGEHGEYDREKNYAFFVLSPKLLIHPDKKDSSISVTSDTMEYFLDEHKGIARKDVHIQKGEMDAYCGESELYTKENRIVLKENPKAKQKGSELSGEEMELYFKDNLVEKILVWGNAEASHKEMVDSLSGRSNTSFLSGKRISFFLENEKLKEVEVKENATSLYYPSSKDTLIQTKNETSGDTINLYLNENEVKRVLIRGGAMGTYYQTKKPNPANVRDSLLTADTIIYSAQRIDYEIDDSLITLENECNLKYGKASLNAGLVKYYTPKQILVASAMVTEEEGKKVIKGLPDLKDGDDEITGHEMVYNLKTRRGKIKAGKTGFEKGFYYGEDMKRINEKIILVKKGIYTTCDLDNPHYHFFSQKMKIIPQDKVIAKPIVLYIADLPVIAIPYYVFPIKRGRHSGFLTFDIGSFEKGNRFIRNLGYYWAPSSYYDFEGSFDFYESSGWTIKGWGRYAVRYLLNGSIAGSYNRQASWAGFTQSKRTRWDLVVRHSQSFSPVTSLSAYGTFISDKSYYKDFSFDPQERRNRTLHSQVNLSTRWSGASIYGALDRNLDLDAGTRTDLLPTLRFSFPAFTPFKSEKGETTTDWYRSLYLTFSSDFSNYSYKEDNEGVVDRKKYSTMDNYLNLIFPQNLFGFLVFSPNFNYQETWYYVFKTDLSEKQNLRPESFARRGVLALSTSFKTTLFGTFYPKIWKLCGIRHVVTPTVGFSWHPEIKKHDEYVSYTGKGGSGGKQESMNFNLSNLFGIKIKDKDKEKKFDIFNFNLGTGYNFVAKAHKLANLSSSLRSNFIRGLDFSFSATHDFYDEKTGELKKRFPRLVYFSLNTNLSLQGKGLSEKSEEESGSSGVQAGGIWGLTISHSYSETKSYGTVSKNHWVNLSLDLWLTKNWHLGYVNRYDFPSKKITEQSFDLYRDMHCWEGRFSWVIQGYRSGYYFKINIKSLPEVKIEKSRGGLREMFF
jgi:lipopolysaccharide assembly outer membrane protein LptD (OstA)